MMSDEREQACYAGAMDEVILPGCAKILGVERLPEPSPAGNRWSVSYIDRQGRWCELDLPELELLRLLHFLQTVKSEMNLPNLRPDQI